MIQTLGNKILYYRHDTKNIGSIEAFIKGEQFQSLISQIKIPLVFVLGGDGTMLAAIDELGEKCLPFYGINLGNKGFLLNDKNFLSSDYIEQKYPLLQGTLQIGENSQILLACNEFDIRSGNGRVIDLRIEINNLFLDFSGDGIVLATPMGSSGYSFSLGGTIVPHEFHLGVLSGKAPLKPKGLSPVLFPLETEVTIERSSFLGPIEIYKDGKFVKEAGKECSFLLKIVKGKEITILISRTQINQWKTRIYREQGFS